MRPGLPDPSSLIPDPRQAGRTRPRRRPTSCASTNSTMRSANTDVSCARRASRCAAVTLGGTLPPANVSSRSSSHIGSLAMSRTNDPSADSVSVTRVRSASCAIAVARARAGQRSEQRPSKHVRVSIRARMNAAFVLLLWPRSVHSAAEENRHRQRDRMPARARHELDAGGRHRSGAERGQPGARQRHPAAPPAGKNTFRLIGVSEFNLPQMKDHTVVIRGLFIKDKVSRINVTSAVEAVASCAPCAPK